MKSRESDERFNPLWLVTFYWVCRCKTKQKAARRLKIDPGTVTYRLEQLEKAWGKKLVDPTLWVGCKITLFGKWLYRFAKLEYLAQENQKKEREKRILSLEAQQLKTESPQGHQ